MKNRHNQIEVYVEKEDEEQEQQTSCREEEI